VAYGCYVRVDEPDLEHLEVESEQPVVATHSSRSARHRWRSAFVAGVLVWAVGIPVLQGIQLHDLRRQVHKLGTGQPDFCPTHPLAGRIHFSNGLIYGEVSGLPPDTHIAARWIANSRKGVTGLEFDGQTDDSGHLRFDGTPTFGAVLIGTMLTMRVAPDGAAQPPGYAC